MDGENNHNRDHQKGSNQRCKCFILPYSFYSNNDATNLKVNSLPETINTLSKASSKFSSKFEDVAMFSRVSDPDQSRRGYFDRIRIHPFRLGSVFFRQIFIRLDSETFFVGSDFLLRSVGTDSLFLKDRSGSG